MWANQPIHSAPCWMPKPLPPKYQCTVGWFAPALLHIYQVHFKFLIAFSKNLHTIAKQYLYLMYTMYANASKRIPLLKYTHVNLQVV